MHLKDIEIRTHISEDMMISVDKEAMDLVFSNLAENAIHYSDRPPKVEMRSGGMISGHA
jgi:signal transduction histidine kinase